MSALKQALLKSSSAVPISYHNNYTSIFLIFFVRLCLYPVTLNLYVQNGHIASFLMIKSVLLPAHLASLTRPTSQQTTHGTNELNQKNKPTNPPNNSSICLWLEMIGPPPKQNVPMLCICVCITSIYSVCIYNSIKFYK